MKFFQFSRKKILLTFFLFFLWFLLTHLYIFSGLSLYCIEVPTNHLAISPPLTMNETLNDFFIMIASYGSGNCLTYDVSYYFALVILFIVQISLAYFIACVYLFYNKDRFISKKIKK